MSGVIAKFFLTAAFGAICAVAAYIVTRPARAPAHERGGGGRGSYPYGYRPRRSSSEDDDDETDTYHTPRRTMEPEEKESCKICLDSFDFIKKSGREIYTTPCGHLFCKKCLLDSLARSTNKNCPICRERVKVNLIHRVYL